jgi:inhibitor of cysteine peptidase
MLFFRKRINDDNELKLFAAQKLMALDDRINYPEKLSPNKIAEHIVPVKGSRFNYQRTIRYSAALAVCFVFVVGIVLSLSVLKKADPSAFVNSRGTLSNNNVVQAASTVITAKNYNDVVSAFETIYKDNTAYNRQNTDMGLAVQNGNAKSTLAQAQTDTNLSVSDTSDHSTTNLQVEGVDEGDVVKNDGSYLYTLFNNKINITDVRDPKNMKLISSLNFDNSNAVELYVYKNKLIVVLNCCQSIVSSSDNKTADNSAADKKAVASDSIRIAYNNQTKVIVYDIADRSKPKEFRSYIQDGNFVSSRMIDNYIYVASSYYAYVKDTGKFSAEEIVPKAGENNNYKMIPAADIYIPKEPKNASYAVVSGINTEDAGAAVSTVACVGSAGNVFASLDNLYLTSQRTVYSTAVKAPDANDKSTANSTANNKSTTKSGAAANGAAIAAAAPVQSTTDIIRFHLKNGKVTYTGACNVDGDTKNQFSMDEYKGYFRIATTSNSTEMTNNLYIFDSNMKLAGSIAGMAKGENIHSVRFMENRAYIVTFRTVDPLFVIDLTNPKAPKVLGELKIPGFSDYLQPYSDNLMIGFGKDATESGNMAYYQGLKLSLFDVSDPLNPKELFDYHIGDRGSTSAVLNDHRALLFDKNKNIIGFPVTIMKLAEGAKNDIHAYGNFKYDGYYVMSVDPSKGFTFMGSVTHLVSGKQNDLYSQGLQMQRGAYIGDVLYTISNAKIASSSLIDFSKLGELSLPYSSGTGKYADPALESAAGSAGSGVTAETGAQK